jgi:hypothetical protein
MSVKPNILQVLGRYRSPRKLSDENLKTLYVYLFMCIVRSDQEMKRRGLSNGNVYLQIASPE